MVSMVILATSLPTSPYISNSCKAYTFTWRGHCPNCSHLMNWTPWLLPSISTFLYNKEYMGVLGNRD